MGVFHKTPPDGTFSGEGRAAYLETHVDGNGLALPTYSYDSAGSPDGLDASNMHGLVQEPSAPTVLPVDYLHDIKILAAGTNYLFGVNSGTATTLSRFTRSTYASVDITGVIGIACSATDGSDVAGATIQWVVVQDATTLWVLTSKSTANAILWKITTSNAWASSAGTTATRSLFLGSDTPNTAAASKGNGFPYGMLSEHSLAIDTNGDIYAVEYQTFQSNTPLVSRIRLFKLPSGSSTWQTVWTLNDSLTSFATATAGNWSISGATLTVNATATGLWVVGQVVGGTASAGSITAGSIITNVVDNGGGSYTITLDRSSTVLLANSLLLYAGPWHAKHFHCCQIDPYTGYLWLSTGDSPDTYWGGGTTRTIADPTWTMRWNKSATLPSGDTYLTGPTMAAALAATTGVNILHGLQQHRQVQFEFRTEGVYTWSDASPEKQPVYVSNGVFFIDHGCSEMTKVYKPELDDQELSGYYSVQTSGGSMVFFPAGVHNTAYFNTHSLGIVTSKNGVDFATAGVIRRVLNVDSIPYGALYDSTSGYCFVCYTNLSGKGTPGGFQTVVFQVQESTPHNKLTHDNKILVRDPEVLHPVYWLDVGNTTGLASDANTGYSPRLPWLTLAKAVAASNMDHGGRLKFLNPTLAISGATASATWSANANQSYTGLFLEFDLRGCAVVHSSNTAWISWTGAVKQHARLLADNFAFDGSVTGTSMSVFQSTGITTNACNMDFYESRVGHINLNVYSSGGRLAFCGAGIISFTRSRIFLGGVAELVQNSGAVAPGNTFKIRGCVIDEATQIATDARTDTIHDIDQSFIHYRQRFVNYTAGTAVSTDQFKCRNSAVISGAGAGVAFTGTNKPTSLSIDPFANCVLNFSYTFSAPIDSISMTPATLAALAAAIFNNPPVANIMQDLTLIADNDSLSKYHPLDPGSGYWNDSRYPGIGPRVSVHADKWISGHTG